MAGAELYDFDNALNSYAERLAEYKTLAQRLANTSPEDAIRTATEVIGTHLGVELLKDGIKQRYGDTVNKFTGLKDRVEGAAKDALDRINGKISDVQSTVRNTVNDAQDQARGLVQGLTEANLDAPSPDISSLLPAGAGGQIDLGNSVMENGVIRAKDAPADAPAEPLNAPEIDLGQPGTEIPLRQMSELIGKEQVRSGRTFLTQSRDDIEDPFGLRAPSRGAVRALSRSPEETGGLRGDSTIARMAQSNQPEAEIQTMAKPNLPAVPTSDAVQEAGVVKQMSQNAAEVSRITGAKGADAALEAETGEVAPDVAEGAEGAESAVAAGAGIAESTGAETEGIGAIVGGLVAVGGVLASIFAPHSQHPIKPPNLSVPVVQLGLGA